MAPITPQLLIEKIHAGPTKLVVAVTGGGSGAISDLLGVPGGSRTLLEAVVPYSAAAMTEYLGARPEQFCSARTARAMAMVAYQRAIWLSGDEADAPVAGIGCTASLASDRPKKGAHRAHVALQTASYTATWSVELAEGIRSRLAEERVAADLILNAMADACGVGEQLDLALEEDEVLTTLKTEAPAEWQDLLAGRIERVGCLKAAAPNAKSQLLAVFPGAFDPLHLGHRGIVQTAGDIAKCPVAYEISIENVDKPPLDFIEIERRVGQFSPEDALWLTRAAAFQEKSRIFPGATFVVGIDTLIRLFDPKYYGDDPDACDAALAEIRRRGCRFLVFGRKIGDEFRTLADIDLPMSLVGICQAVPPEAFRQDISSTELRRQEIDE